MMIEPATQEPEYMPRPVVIDSVDLARLRKLVDQLPDGTVYSIDMEVFADGKKEK